MSPRGPVRPPFSRGTKRVTASGARGPAKSRFHPRPYLTYGLPYTARHPPPHPSVTTPAEFKIRDRAPIRGAQFLETAARYGPALLRLRHRLRLRRRLHLILLDPATHPRAVLAIGALLTRQLVEALNSRLGEGHFLGGDENPGAAEAPWLKFR
jgi:hypothetical protein